METAATETAPATASGLDQAQGWVTRLIDYSARMVVEYGLRVLGALVVLVIAYFLASWTKRGVLAALDKARFDPTISRFASNVARYAVIILGLISCAPILGINITAFAAVIGSLGLAVGLASQGALSNGAAGLMLLITRPFKAGDAIVVDGVSGIVEEIELFATTLNTPDNRRIFMPNNAIFGKVVENSTINPQRSTTFFTVVAANSDVEKVRATLIQACIPCPSVLKDPPPIALLADLLEGGLKWSITVWAATGMLERARDEAITAVRDAMVRNEIRGPAPVTTIRLLDRPAEATLARAASE